MFGGFGVAVLGVWIISQILVGNALERLQVV